MATEHLVWQTFCGKVETFCDFIHFFPQYGTDNFCLSDLHDNSQTRLSLQPQNYWPLTFGSHLESKQKTFSAFYKCQHPLGMLMYRLLSPRPSLEGYFGRKTVGFKVCWFLTAFAWRAHNSGVPLLLAQFFIRILWKCNIWIVGSRWMKPYDIWKEHLRSVGVVTKNFRCQGNQKLYLCW